MSTHQSTSICTAEVECPEHGRIFDFSFVKQNSVIEFPDAMLVAEQPNPQRPLSRYTWGGDPFFHRLKNPVPNPQALLQHSVMHLSHQLYNTTSLLDLLLSQLADPSCADNQGDFGDAALSEQLGVAEREKVEDGDGVLLLAGDVGIAGLGGDE